MDPENIRALIAVAVLIVVSVVIAKIFVGKPKGVRKKADESEVVKLDRCVTGLVFKVDNLQKDLDDATASMAERIKTLERQVAALGRSPA